MVAMEEPAVSMHSKTRECLNPAAGWSKEHFSRHLNNWKENNMLPCLRMYMQFAHLFFFFS